MRYHLICASNMHIIPGSYGSLTQASPKPDPDYYQTDSLAVEIYGSILYNNNNNGHND